MSRAKFPALKEKIREDLSRRRLGAEQALPTEGQYAALYDTTPKTVRRALRELAAEGLLSHGRGRRTTLRRELAWQSRLPFLVGSSAATVGGIFGRMIAGMRGAAARLGLELVVKENAENHARAREDIKELFRTGARVILHAPFGADSAEGEGVDRFLLAQAAEHGAAVITVDRRAWANHGPRGMHVASDNYLGGTLAALELLIGPYQDYHWAMLGSRETSATQDRVAGFAGVLKSAGKGAPKGIVLGPRTKGAGLCNALKAGRPQGVFILADFAALHFMAWLREQGLGQLPPSQLGLITFDDLEVSRAFGLAALDQNLEEIGGAAVGEAARYLKDPTYVGKDILFPPRLVRRPSYVGPERPAK